MVLAETVATQPLHGSGRYWPFVDRWAAELGLTGPDAVIRACQSPELAAHDPRLRCSCGPPDTCPFPRHPIRDAKPFSSFTAADWSAYHAWASHRLRADTDRHEAAGDTPPEVLARWRASADKHDRWAVDRLDPVRSR